MQQLAGGASFERGETYAAEGCVRSLVVHGDVLMATVRGSEDYAVRLAAADGALTHACGARMDYADACLVRLSELHRERVIVTTDAKDFRLYRRLRRKRLPLLAH